MTDFTFKGLAQQSRRGLLEDVIPFWMNHSLDWEKGGYFTCLDRVGKVFDTDKFIWLQARQVWMFAKLYNEVEKRGEWLEAARLGADFLREHGRAEDGNWYFSLNRAGEPLIVPYNIFSDCFGAMAFAQYGLASGEEWAIESARETYENILLRQGNPKGKWNKIVPGTRPMRNFALPMILCNLSLELEGVISGDLLEETIDRCLQIVMGDFYQTGSGTIVENIGGDGELVDCFEGRMLLPGHAIEAMWFVMELAKRRKDPMLAEKAVDVTLNMLELGWDNQYEGIFYYLDRLGKPPLQLEWDQKLWWVHLETLIALASGYELTQRAACREWYKKVHDYTWSHFSDPEFGEWYGYLNRRGEVLIPIKGSKWKGCFHVPRGLLKLWTIFERMEKAGGEW